MDAVQSVHSCEAMSLRSTVSQSVRAPRGAWCSAAAWTMMMLLLSACSAVASASASPSQGALGLLTASSGLCETIAALPDISAAERTFTNRAHEALHALAADPRLDRSVSARLLEAMENVHTDFSQVSDAAVLSEDLGQLHASADAALAVLGMEAPTCAE